MKVDLLAAVEGTCSTADVLIIVTIAMCPFVVMVSSLLLAAFISQRMTFPRLNLILEILSVWASNEQVSSYRTGAKVPFQDDAADTFAMRWLFHSRTSELLPPAWMIIRVPIGQ
eukprot:s1639_g2.t1